MSSASKEELERLRCVLSEEKDVPRACGGTPCPEQCVAPKVDSSQDTRNSQYVELATDLLDGEVAPSIRRPTGKQPLHPFSGIWDEADTPYQGDGLLEGAFGPQRPSAASSGEGQGQARRPDDAVNPSHVKVLGTDPAPSARSQADVASRMSKEFADGSAGDGTAMERVDLSDGNCRQQQRRKRKLPVPELAPTEYPGGERLQQRLVKNRRTAAASRERKQREVESLAAKVQALEVDNAGLKQALRHRNAEILALRAQLPPPERLVPEPAKAAASRWPPLRPGFPAWPPPWRHRQPSDELLNQKHMQAAHSPMQPASGFGLLGGTEPGHAPGSGGRPTGSGGFRPPDAWLLRRVPSLGQPLTEQPRKSIGSASSLSSTEAGSAWLQQLRSMSASGLAAEARSGFIRGVDGQYLCLASGASLSSQKPPMPLPPAPGQLLRARSSSCPDAPPGVPAVEWAGGPAEGACPSGQLLRARSGSYPPQPQHMLAHVDRRHLASSLDTSTSLPDPGSFDQMDFDNLWAQFSS